MDIKHYTIFDKDTDEVVGCSTVLFSEKAREKLGVNMRKSDINLCEDCREDE